MSRLVAAFTLVLFCFAFTVSAQDQEIHVVLPGENLFRIAQQYGVDVDAIAHANNITNTWRIYTGQKLIIPQVSAAPQNVAPSQATLTMTQQIIPPTSQPTTAPLIVPTTAPTQYTTVARGQSLAQIARNYGMSVEQLAQINHITNPNLIYAGQRLIVSQTTQNTADSAPPPLTSGNVSPVTYIVQPGETLASIGQHFGVSWLQIAQANNIFDANHVTSGQELIIPGASTASGTNNSLASPSAAPPARIGVGKEIIVDLSNSRIYAYQDGNLIRNDLVSTGLPGSPTIKGSFTIRRKYIAQTMTGPGYYLPDVPYVMYFYGGYALHGTYWHNNFGHPMSHGCVNLPTSEAEWFYNFTDIGTPVYIQP